jgi:TonB family protein
VVHLIPGSIMKNCLQSNPALPSLSLRSAMPSACLVAIVMSLSACQKSDLGPTTAERLKSAEQRQQTVPDFYVPRKTVDYMSDLKAIKETTPPVEPPKKDVPAKDLPTKEAALKTPADAKGAAGKAATAAVPVTTAAAPTLTPSGALGGAPIAVTPTPAPTTPPPKAAEPVIAPAPAVVASAAPTSRPTPSQDASPVISVVAREQPEFPRDAARQGVESGAVRARLTINASGDVTNVAIVQARPLRVFDRAVTTALSRWKFNAGADGRTYETEVSFSRQ